MILRFVNTTLLALVSLLTLTGVFGIVWRMEGWAYDLHRILGWALIALIPWKVAISAGSLRRGLKPNVDRGVMPILSMLLSGATMLVIVLGVMWAWKVGPNTLWMRQSVISWHWILAVALIIPFVVHAWARWPRPKKSEFLSRRGFLKLAGLSAAAMVGWGISSRIARQRQDAVAVRAATGSRLAGYLTGNDFPVTNSAGDGGKAIDLASWTFKVLGTVEQELSLSYEDLLALSSIRKIATIDCTVGWYSVQRWQGVLLTDILQMAEAVEEAWGVSLRAVEGYTHNVPKAELGEVLLATHVGGEVLDHVHGFPLRAVVPSRRGWFWVKWLNEIEVI